MKILDFLKITPTDSKEASDEPRETDFYGKYAKLRDARGLNDWQVCKATGINSASMSNWKAGRYQPKVDKLKTLADYFGVPVNYFVD